MRRAASAPPVVFGSTLSAAALPHELGGISADTWGAAACPKLLELLRRQLAAVREEVGTLRIKVRDGTIACNEWAAQTEANRRRVRDLLEEESAATWAEGASATAERESWQARDAAGSKSVEKSVAAALRAETEALVSEVSAAAALQMARCRSLSGLRAAARLARLKRGARVAEEARRRLGVEWHDRMSEVEAAMEAAAALRLQARGLREEVAAVEDDEFFGGTSNRSVANAPDEMLTALRSEVAAEEQRCRLALLADSAQEEAQAALRRRAAGLSMRLAATEADACRAAGALECAERQEFLLASELAESRRQASSLTSRIGTRTVACQLLEAELQQQRDATFAWWACADNLADGHHDNVNEADYARSPCIRAHSDHVDLRCDPDNLPWTGVWEAAAAQGASIPGGFGAPSAPGWSCRKPVPQAVRSRPLLPTAPALPLIPSRAPW